MADILSLVATPSAIPVVAGAVIGLDGVAATLPLLAADPFAAFLASAQATSPAAVPGQPIAVPQVKFPTTIVVAEGEAQAADTPVPSESEAQDMPDETLPAPVVDPALLPALAMLSALAQPAPGSSRLVTAPAMSRVATAAKPVQHRPAVAATAPPPAAAPTAPLPATARLAAATSPLSRGTPAVATPVAPSTTSAAPEIAATPNHMPAAEQIVLAPQGQPSEAPTTTAPTLPVGIAAGIPVPTPDRAPSQAGASIVVAAPNKPPTPALDAQPATPDEPASAIVAETAVPVAGPTARPVKMRPPEARPTHGKDVEAAPVLKGPDRPRVATPPLRVAAGDVVRAEPIVAPTVPAASDAAGPTAARPAPAADGLVQRQLIIADDGRWLDSLARDITKSASGETIQFRLQPANLGNLTVAIAQGSDGTAIRMTAETHRARDLLIEAQPALVAEARANGLRISETHVDLGSASRDGGNANNPNNAANASNPGQQSLANNSTGQQAMRQDGGARRQPDLPASQTARPRSAEADTTARDSGERFA